MFECRAPETEQELNAYYALRWEILRQPWGQPTGSEQDLLESQASHRVVFDESKQLIGVGRLHKVDQYTGQLRYMAVAETHQGQGIGKTLLVELEKSAIKQGVKTLRLNAREQAVKFYQKLGYSLEGSESLLFGEIKHFTMTKNLSSITSHKHQLAAQLQSVWHQSIPLSKAMNMHINHACDNSLYTSCDLIFNKNLHNTMFAGSIYTLATLTGWGWLYLQLAEQEISAEIVLADANIRYLAPLAGAGYAMTQGELVEGTFERQPSQKNIKMKICVNVYCGDTVAAVFTGIYFAKLN